MQESEFIGAMNKMNKLNLNSDNGEKSTGENSPETGSSNSGNKQTSEITPKIQTEILQVSNFPSAFTTLDIALIFTVLPVKISWVSDVECMCYFGSIVDCEAALNALNESNGNCDTNIADTAIAVKEVPESDNGPWKKITNPVYKIPTSNGIKIAKRGPFYYISSNGYVPLSSLTKTPIDLNVTTVKPYVKAGTRQTRPTTSDSVARRLIAGALGVRPLKKTDSELEQDEIKFNKVRSTRG